MAKRKTGFNLMDAVILVAILAVVALLLYVFVFSESASVQAGNTDSYTLTYVVEATKISEEFADKISIGDTVIDSAKKMRIGTVTAVEVKPYEHMATNLHEGKLVLTPVDGYKNLEITVQADAVLDGISYSINGYEVYVGAKIFLSFGDMVCSGYCISLDAAQ